MKLCRSALGIDFGRAVSCIRFDSTGILVLLVLFWLSGRLSMGQQDKNVAEKYFLLLRERPGNSYLYDRFYNAWLDAGTVEQLETFLKGNLDTRKDIAGRLLLALFYERQGRDAKALELFRDVPIGCPVTSEYLFHRARVEARNLNFEAAISDLVETRRLPGPEEIVEKANTLLGELYIRTDQNDKATELWRQLLEAGSEDQGLCEDLIELQIKEGLFDEALAMSNELISTTKDPYKVVMCRLRQGDIYQYKGDNEKALDVYAEALDKVGEGSWLENQIYAQIEQIFDRDDDSNGLKDYLTDLVQAHPTRTGLRKQLANLLLAIGRADDALDMFREICEVTPGDKANQKAYAKILAGAGQRDKAITLLEQLFKRDTQDTELLISLADLYHRNQQNEKAGTTLGRFLDLSDKAEYAYLRVGGLLEQYGLPERAEAVYEQMMGVLPESLSARLVYAEFLYRTEREEAALDIFRAVAGAGDLQMMMRASNAAGARGHNDLALQWAEARYDAFSDDVTYLNHLCKIAIRLEEFEKAIVWARHQLQMAEGFPMIRSALSQIVASVNSDEQARRLIQELEAAASVTIQQACLLSELLESQNLALQADTVLTEAARNDPDIAARQQIHLYRLRRDWAQAAESMEALLTRSNTREPKLMREMVELFQKCGRYEEALAWVVEWERISPGSAAPRLCHSQLLRAVGRDEDAVGLVEAASREFEGDTEVLSQLAELYTSIGRFEDAQRTYWRLYEAAQNIPAKLDCVRDMVNAAAKVGARGTLIERLKRQRQKNPSSAVPLLGLAEVYKHMGQYEGCRQALLEASRLQTEDLSLLYELASIEEAQGHWEKAVGTLQRAMALDSTSKTRLKIARLYIQHGDREDGFRILTEVAGGDTMDPRDAESIAGTMMSIGAWDTAIRFLQGVLSSHPKDYKLRYQYAVAFEEAGRTAEAIEAFVDLLGFAEEIPGNTGRKIPLIWSRQGMDTNIERILPAEAVRLLRLDQCHSTAYRYQRERIRHSRSDSQRPTHVPVNVALPPTVDDLRDFAVSHILTLAEDLGSQGRSQVASDLHRHGIANYDVLMAMSRFGLPNFREAIDNLAQEQPDNEAIQAVWILHRIEGQGCTLKEAQRIFDMFEHTHPRLALIVGLRCYGRDPVASRLFRKSMAMLQDVLDPGYYEISSIAYVLQNSHSTVRLTDEQRAFLDRHLIGWYAQLNRTVASRIHIFNHVGSLLAQRTDLSDYVRFLDNEVAGSLNASSSIVVLPSGRPMIWHLSYPPRNIPGFPDHVVKMVLDGPQFYFPTSSRASKVDPARLGKYLHEIQNPMLRILVAMASGRNEDAETINKALLEENPTSLAGYAMAASQATVNGKPLEVIALLDKARSLPMSVQYRRLLDGALVASAMELDQQKHRSEIDLAKRAVLRLMSDRLDPERREELLAATETLGLAEEAENLRNQILDSAGRRSASPGGYRAFHAHPFTVALIARFFETGQTDAALRLSLNHLKNEAHDSLYYGFSGSSSSVIRDIVKLAGKHGAVEMLAALAVPPDDAHVRQLVEYGRICELLELKAEAVTVYEKAVGLNPTDVAARTRLALMSAKADPTNSAKHLAGINGRDMNGVGFRLVQSARRLFNTGQVDASLDIARVVTEYLALIEAPENQNLDWVDHLADAIAAGCGHRTCRLHHLYQDTSPPTTDGMGSRGRRSLSNSRITVRGGYGSFSNQMRMSWDSSFRENARAAHDRRSVHNQLCRKMLDIPQLAEVAFARLTGEAGARHALTDQYAEMARHAMLTHQPYHQTSPLSTTSNSMRQTSLVGPAEYLVRHAHRNGTLDKLVHEFVPPLRLKGADEQAEKLIGFANMYTVSPDRFFTAVDSFLSAGTAKGPSQGQATTDEKGRVRFVIDAYLTRDPDNYQGMGQFIQDKIEEDIARSRFVHHHLAESWLMNLMDRDTASARAFLNSVLALYSSPKGKVSGLDGHFRSYAFALDNRPGNKSRIQQSSAKRRFPGSASDRNRGSRIGTRRPTNTRRSSRTRY